MPAVRMFGRKWRVSSDFLPVFACVGLVFHFFWVIFIIVWPFGITPVRQCDNTKAGRQFLSSVALFFGLHVLSFIQELLITLIGLRGTPLETSKRRAMYPVLYTQIFNWIGQVGVVCYGTYVVRHYSVQIVLSDCNDASVVMLKVLVWSSWAMLVFNWGRLLVIYNLFPDYERVDSWAKRIRFYTWYSRSKSVITHLEKHQRRPLGRLAELYSRLLHGADLSPSDEFVSLILLSAAQRKSRQAHIRNALKLHKQQNAAARQQADKAGSDDGRAPPPPSSHDPSTDPSQSGLQFMSSQLHEHSAQSHRQPHGDNRDPSQQDDQLNGEAEQASAHHSGTTAGSVQNPDTQSRSHTESRSETKEWPVTQRHAEAQDQQVSHGNAEHSAHLEELGDDMDPEMQETLSRIHTPNAADDRGLTGSPEQSPGQTPEHSPEVSPEQSPNQSLAGSRTASQSTAQHDRGSHVIDIPAEGPEAIPPQCSVSSVHGRAPAGGKVKRRSQPASSKKANVQDLKEMEEGSAGADSYTQQKKSGQNGKQRNHSRQSSRRHLNQDEFFRRDFMLAPSSYACEYDPDVAPDKLADMYTGYKERVSRPEVTEAARFAKYAIAAYGAAGFQYLHQTSKAQNTYNLLRNRGKDKYKANKLMSSKIVTLEQHLDYEAIVQIAEIEDQDLLYLNFDNQALGDLPYMLALDRPTKSIVVAIRGTVSVADLATDMLADPEPMEEWLPDTMTQAEEAVLEQGPRRAHAGIMAAATAIWKDLRAHRILPALLNLPDDETDNEDNPEYDIGAGEHDGFEQAYGPDEDPEPSPEEQRLPAPQEPPGAYSKREPVPPPGSSSPASPADSQGRSFRKRRRPVRQKSNPIALVGKGVKAGVTTLQEVPQQAVGHIMGGAGGTHRSQKQFKQQVMAERAGVSPHTGAAGNSPHETSKADGKITERQKRRAAAAKQRQRHESRSSDARGAQVNAQQAGQQSQTAAVNCTADGDANSQEDGERLAAWDKVRKVVRGSATATSKPVKDSVTAALESKSPPPEGNPESRHLNHSDSSSGSMSQNTSGPMQYIYSRGGKMAAVLAMLGSRGSKKEQKEEGDLEARDTADGVLHPQESDHSDSCHITSPGAENHPGDDPVSKFGAQRPQKAAGSQSSCDSEIVAEIETQESKDSSTRNRYAAHIVRQGLNKEGWKLVITGHSLGAGAAALIALKLRDRFPETKCWAFCPPGGLLTPNMAHSMKTFCTSVVVNKDCIPRMSLKNLNRFMEGKLMALACSRLNAFQIFWGSYGKVNRRGFFDRDIFRPFSEIPEEARQMLEKFQECTLTDVSAQDMVPPGRVMYLRRFKASPNACPIKQQEHRRRARARKVFKKPTTATVQGVRRMTSSDSDSSGNQSTLQSLKQRLSLSSSDEQEDSPGHARGRQHEAQSGLAEPFHRQPRSRSQQDSSRLNRTSDHPEQHDASGHDHQQQQEAGRDHRAGDERDRDANDDDHHEGAGEPEQSEYEDEEAYRQAGLQKPKKPGEDDEDVGDSFSIFPHRRTRKQREKALHDSLQNPKDLFWDAVWIQPEDIIREGLLVSPKMTEDHYTTSLLRSLKAVSERLAHQEGVSGKGETQGSSQVAAADKKSSEKGQQSQGNESGGVKEAALGGVFDLV